MVLDFIPPLDHFQTEFSILLDQWIKALKYYATPAEKSLFIEFSMRLRDLHLDTDIINCMESFLKMLIAQKEEEDTKRKYLLEGMLLTEVLRVLIYSRATNLDLINTKLAEIMNNHPEVASDLEQAALDKKDSRNQFLQYLWACKFHEDNRILFKKHNKTILMIAFGLLEERSTYYQTGGKPTESTKRRNLAFQLITGVIATKRQRRSAVSTSALVDSNQSIPLRKSQQCKGRKVNRKRPREEEEGQAMTQTLHHTNPNPNTNPPPVETSLLSFSWNTRSVGSEFSFSWPSAAAGVVATEVMSYKQHCPAAIACNKEEQQEEVDDRSVVSDLTDACCCESQQLQEEEDDDDAQQTCCSTRINDVNVTEDAAIVAYYGEYFADNISEEKEGNDDGTVNLPEPSQGPQHLNDDLSLSLSLPSFASSILRLPFFPSMSTMSMPTTMTSDVCY